MCLSHACGLCVVASLILQQPAAGPAQPAPESFTLPKVFHIAGIPKLARDARGDLTLTDSSLVFKYKKNQELKVPYERLRRAELLSGERHHEGGTVAAATAAGLAGALLIVKRRKVDTLLFEYDNERGGRMGLVIQVPETRGVACADWLARFGVDVTRP